MFKNQYEPDEVVFFLEREGYCGTTVLHYCSGAVANQYDSLD